MPPLLPAAEHETYAPNSSYCWVPIARAISKLGDEAVAKQLVQQLQRTLASAREGSYFRVPETARAIAAAGVELSSDLFIRRLLEETRAFRGHGRSQEELFYALVKGLRQSIMADTLQMVIEDSGLREEMDGVDRRLLLEKAGELASGIPEIELILRLLGIDDRFKSGGYGALHLICRRTKVRLTPNGDLVIRDAAGSHG